MKLAIYGEIGIDWMVGSNGSVIDRWGGSGLYAALAAARQNGEVELLTHIGPELNRSVYSLWEYLGVSFDFAEFNKGYSIPRYLVTGYQNYEIKTSRPMSEVKSIHNHVPSLPPDSEGLLVFPLGHSIPIELIKEAFNKGIPVFLDPKPNHDSISDARKALPYATVLLANEEEILLLAEENECEAAINKLGVGLEFIIVKRGIRGCSIFYKGKLFREVMAYKSSAKCTLGSGDVFGGALAIIFMETEDIEYSVDFASCVAANFIENFEVEAIISRKATEKDMIIREKVKVPDKPIRVYLAGPFFSEQELSWINQICNKLEGAGIQVLSPSRENGIINPDDRFEQRKDIFKRDLELIEKSDLVVAVLDHNDTGTCFEMGYAFRKNIPIIGLKTSTNLLNNMIAFGCNKICSTVEDLIEEVYVYGQ